MHINGLDFTKNCKSLIFWSCSTALIFEEKKKQAAKPFSIYGRLKSVQKSQTFNESILGCNGLSCRARGPIDNP